jgi:putative transposase
MPAGLERRYGKGHLHFITFSCYRRLPLLRSLRTKKIFVETLDKVRDRYGFVIVGYVVMPEHVHLLISEPPKATPSTVLQVLKQGVSRRLRREPDGPAHATHFAISFGPPSAPPPRFWEPRFYDFNVWSQTKKVEKLQYMHMNPVKRGLVEHPKDWAWSSFSFYATGEQGLLRIDLVR